MVENVVFIFFKVVVSYFEEIFLERAKILRGSILLRTQ
jgi:hypothetical protein